MAGPVDPIDIIVYTAGTIANFVYRISSEVSYLGSKAATGAFQTIIALMPPHDTYIETHLGSGAVMLKKPPAARNIGIEIDPQTIAEFWPIEKTAPAGIDIHNCAAEYFIAEYDYCGHELIYSDPPYLHSTRSSNSRYRYEYSEQQHIELLALLKTRPCNVILSGYPSKLYEELLPDWNSKEFQVMTRGGVRTEKLWFNFEPSSRHWATFAGKNFTDRQRIKRKAERWAKNYRALPDDEKTAVLSALLFQPDPA